MHYSWDIGFTWFHYRFWDANHFCQTKANQPTSSELTHPASLRIASQLEGVVREAEHLQRLGLRPTWQQRKHPGAWRHRSLRQVLLDFEAKNGIFALKKMWFHTSGIFGGPQTNAAKEDFGRWEILNWPRWHGRSEFQKDPWDFASTNGYILTFGCSPNVGLISEPKLMNSCSHPNRLGAMLFLSQIPPKNVQLCFLHIWFLAVKKECPRIKKK